ncbi:MAG: hypothetical protein IKB16_00200 [Lentisphaeria bacterium]|nr:hypothetical protein [Lentisphaeria bacterium]
MKQKYLNAFSWVWNYFFRFKLPGLPAVDPRYIPPFARVIFPLVGTAAGAMVYFACLLIRYVIGNTAAILFFVFTGVFLLDMLRKFRGFKLFCTWCNRRFHGSSPEDALDFTQPESWKEKDLPEQLLPFTIYIFRGVLFGLLAWHHAAVWSVFALTGSFLVMAELASLRDERTWNELIPVPEGFAMYHWFAAGLALLVFGVFTGHPGGAVATFLIAWGMTKYGRYLHERLDDLITIKQLEYWGYFTEMCLLLAGALLAGH